MPRLRYFTSLILLTLWLPVRLHCGWEAAGLPETFACASEHHADANPMADACDTVEGAALRTHAVVLAAPAPALLPAPLGLLACLLAATPLVAPPAGVSEFTAAPEELGRRWCFLARTAPSPRAPSLLS
ncbi:hypothetical protein K0B96_13095 [Horticoccus luteus]|uniref:Uncharacterized protein n=1 Tax=Horticoccus luteus TaxID=2862869 RepID=A0A8F9XFL6_9BACT|nr:hypothetical protein [Horticoccus luteus]QYM78232.1 hypothetical protein K0B96_13095 [Horticoccus luteus]